MVAFFIPDINHISLSSFEMKQEHKNSCTSTNNNNSLVSMFLFKFVGFEAYSLH